MDKKPEFSEPRRDDDLNVPTSEQTSETDYTLLASYISRDMSEETKNRKIKAEQVRDYIASEKIRPLSIKQKLLNFLGLK